MQITPGIETLQNGISCIDNLNSCPENHGLIHGREKHMDDHESYPTTIEKEKLDINRIKASWKNGETKTNYCTEEAFWNHLFTTKTQLLLDEFTFFDKDGNMIPLSDDHIRKHEDVKDGIYFSGRVKPLYLRDDEGKKQKFVSGCCPRQQCEGSSDVIGGPIEEWWMNLCGDSHPLVGITSKLADYYLLVPSNIYQHIHEKHLQNIQITMATQQIVQDVAKSLVPTYLEKQKEEENLAIVNNLVQNLVIGITPE